MDLMNDELGSSNETSVTATRNGNEAIGVEAERLSDVSDQEMTIPATKTETNTSIASTNISGFNIPLPPGTNQHPRAHRTHPYKTRSSSILIWRSYNNIKQLATTTIRLYSNTPRLKVATSSAPLQHVSTRSNRNPTHRPLQLSGAAMR
jgi:hypothetical protein